jgi:Uma2 family endonuclease
MGLPAEKHCYSIAEYLERESKADFRSEYDNGDILAMAGGTYAHSRIAMNVGRSVGNSLDGSPCFALDSNMRVRIQGRANYVYPDVSIVCGKPEFDAEDPKQTTIVNPRVVIEVLSSGTEAYDRGDKFSLYRCLDSLQEYVLVSQDQARVEVFTRQADGSWNFNHFDGLEATARLRSVGIELRLTDLYAGIELKAAE